MPRPLPAPFLIGTEEDGGLCLESLASGNLLVSVVENHIASASAHGVEVNPEIALRLSAQLARRIAEQLVGPLAARCREAAYQLHREAVSLGDRLEAEQQAADSEPPRIGLELVH